MMNDHKHPEYMGGGSVLLIGLVFWLVFMLIGDMRTELRQLTAACAAKGIVVKPALVK